MYLVLPSGVLISKQRFPSVIKQYGQYTVRIRFLVILLFIVGGTPTRNQTLLTSFVAMSPRSEVGA